MGHQSCDTMVLTIKVVTSKGTPPKLRSDTGALYEYRTVCEKPRHTQNRHELFSELWAANDKIVEAK